MKNSTNSQPNTIERSYSGNKAARILSSIGRTTKRTILNIPNKIASYFNKLITDYKRKPKRKDINRVYVLVGYTTKSHIDAKYNAERSMMILRRGLLILIFVLLLFISVNTVLPMVNTESYSQIFGIDSVDQITENDPFMVESTDVSASESEISVTNEGEN